MKKTLAILALVFASPWLSAQEGDEPVLLSPKETMRRLEKKFENKGAAQEPAVDPIPAKGEPDDYPRITGEEQGKIEVPAAAQAPEAPRVEVPAQSAKDSSGDLKAGVDDLSEYQKTKKTISTVAFIGATGGWLLGLVSILLSIANPALVPLIAIGFGLGFLGWGVMYVNHHTGSDGRGLGPALGRAVGFIGGFLLAGVLFGGWAGLFGALFGFAAGKHGGQAVENAVLGKPQEEPQKKN